MKWDEWLKKIIKEITSDYTISEETSKSFFEKLMQMCAAHLRQKKEEDYDYENEERRHP